MSGEGSDLLQTAVAGVALGGKYALVALGFVIVFKATGILNFAQAAFVVVGAYLTYQLGARWGLPFWLAVALAAVVCSLLAAAVERTVIRPLSDREEFAVIMATIALMFVFEALTTATWGSDPLNLGDPWGVRTVEGLGVSLALRDLWAIVITAVLIAGFFAFFRYSRTGLAMRATALDPEAALAQGIGPRRIALVAWVLAGAVGAVGGAMLATGSAALHPGLTITAFAALPAMMLGGIDSPAGAVVGGVLIGLAQQFTALLQPQHLELLGVGFDLVVPYLVMVLVLVVWPSGLFGTREVQRF